MTPKQTALVQVAKLVAVYMVGGALLASAFAFFTVPQIGIAFSVLVLLGLIKLIYDLELTKAEQEAQKNLK